MLKVGQQEATGSEGLLVTAWTLTEGTVKMPHMCTSIITELEYGRMNAAVSCELTTSPLLALSGVMPERQFGGTQFVCSVVASHVSHQPSSIFSFVWIAPPPGTGCVNFLWDSHSLSMQAPPPAVMAHDHSLMIHWTEISFLASSFHCFISKEKLCSFSFPCWFGIFFLSPLTGNILWLSFPVVLFAGDLQPRVDNQSKCN